jgi:ferrous-iron efflux pump FieF
VMLISTFFTVLLVTYQNYVLRRTKSHIIKADELHYRTDIMVNGAVIVSFLLIMYFKIYFLDSVFAFLIAIYIFKGAWGVGKEAFDKLMDKELSDEERKKIIDIALSNKQVKGIHDLRTRSIGSKPFIQFHLELDGNIILHEAHRIADSVESDLLKTFPNAEIIIHEDPVAAHPISLEKGHVVPVRK